jgi:hypothetical protein
MNITDLSYANVSSSDRSCTIYFSTYPPVSSGATFNVIVNGARYDIFPNEINPGEYRQGIYNLKYGTNIIQVVVNDTESDELEVLVEGQEDEVLPQRTPTPPVIYTSDVSILRRLPCKIEYRVSSTDPVIGHFYSIDNGKTWDEIEPNYLDGKYSFTLYFKKAGTHTLLLRVMDNYWDTSEDTPVEINILSGEGDIAGYITEDTESFALTIDYSDGVESEQPRVYYIINCGGYTSESYANDAKQKLVNAGFTDTAIEKVER